ncbi:MAG: DUF4097 domain-containing protein [Butyrivibrio sp.]|jgi:hypothetical protein|nr:DUF4097 domain-containing protein [Butyrivibrio sp.]
MNRKIYREILTTVTVICVICGTVYHIGGAFFGHVTDRWNWSDLTGWNGEMQEDVGNTKPSAKEGLDPFTSISTDVSVMDLTISRGDGYAISYSASEKLVPQYSVQNGVLKITQRSGGVSLFGIHSDHCKVTLTVPRDAQLERVETDSDVGDTTLSGLNLRSSSLQSDTGDISVKDSALGQTEISTDTGDISLTDCTFSKADVSSDVGDMDVKTDMDLGSWQLDLSTSVGTVNVNGDERGKEYTQSGTAGALEVEGSVGDVTVAY